MVAAICGWHEHHEQAVREIEGRRGRGERLLIAAAGLVEAYAVLTRLPPPHRLSPADTRALLAGNFMGDMGGIVALGADVYTRLVLTAPERNIAGRTIYDAVIVASGLAADADVLLTFNERQFRALAPTEIQIVVPA